MSDSAEWERNTGGDGAATGARHGDAGFRFGKGGRPASDSIQDLTGDPLD